MMTLVSVLLLTQFFVDLSMVLVEKFVIWLLIIAT